MAAKAVPGDDEARPLLFTRDEARRRVRRSQDALLLLAAALVTGTAGAIARSAPPEDAQFGQAFEVLLGWAGGLWRLALVVTLLATAVVVVGAAVRRRAGLLRDLLIAWGGLVVLAVVLSRVAGPDWWPFDDDLWARWGFPELRIAGVMALAGVVGPELVVPARRALHWLIGAASLGVLAIGSALPSEVLGGLASGLAVAALVRLGLGSAAGIPASSEVRASMWALGVPVEHLEPAARQVVGSAAYVGRDERGRPIRVRVLGRDAQDTQRLARRWRLLAYRDPPRSAPVGRLEQVEHEGLATLMARQAGVNVPEVVIAALGPGGHAGIVTRQPLLPTLEEMAPEQVDSDLLDAVWRQVAILHGAGISHGRLNGAHILVDGVEPMLVGFDAATLGAPDTSLNLDVAELLVACTVLVGAERALASAISGLGHGPIRSALPFLQRAALTPHVRRLARAADVAVDELRTVAAEATGSDAVQLVTLRRIRTRDVLTTVAVGFAAYLLIGQLADIGFDTMADNLSRAEPAWLVAGLLLAALAFLPEAISLRGAVPTPLPLGPCVALKSALKFIGLTVPGSAGTVAATVRFVQRTGGSSGAAVASGAVDDVAEKLVQLTLVLLMVPLAGTSVATSDFHVSAPDGRLVVGILVAIVVGALVIWRVPVVGNKVIPPLREGLRALSVFRDRRKRIELFGGNLGGELIFALTLGSVCQAYGVDLTIAELLLVNVGASVLAGFIPVPGGVGAAEAVLTAGLVRLGVDQSTAFAIAVSHRMCTNYLPPIWGYFSLRWLRRQAYL